MNKWYLVILSAYVVVLIGCSTVATCFGEIRPDRKDDLIWENEYSGYRAFGPALQATGEKSYGYDVFTKSVSYPVMHGRFEKSLGSERISFHRDHGDGMDAPCPIVVGIVVHAENPEGFYADNHVLAVADLGDRNIGQNGEIYCGVRFRNGFDHFGFEAFDEPKGAAIGHVLGYSTCYPGKTFTYWFGSGWSKAGIESLEDWISKIR